MDNETAELLLEILPESQRLWYCQTHQATAWGERACWVEQMGGDLCRMVSAILIIPLSAGNQ